jgi:hypothetical protein
VKALNVILKLSHTRTRERGFRFGFKAFTRAQPGGRKPMTAFPFGKWKDRPLDAVDVGYLRWSLVGCRLSSGLRSAVVAELDRRGLTPPPAPPPKPIPPCGNCGDASPGRLLHGQCRNGQPYIRRECCGCGRSRGHAPLTDANRAEADKLASPTALLDALTLCEEHGVQLRSDGAAVSFESGADWARAPDQLRRAIRQANHTLATMLGKTKSAPRSVA